MVGHVLGIGDRHVQNILIDSQTGEQVHIDFGIAFDQGKTLTMPEVIPFRLSRDVIDGMGCAGTRGAFFSSSVDCMSELRQNYQALTTILDVLIHDPLYRWMLTPGDASRFQRDKEESQSGEQSMVPPDNQAAERALFRVKQKLQGYSDTTHDALSVEGQVTHLIAEATDRDNLCVLFPGWSPWL
jgi:ataxia telangiectasia mutated family protein